MAWETRGNKRYWYESQRVGDRVRKVYGGEGILGECSELIAKRARWEREKKRLDAREEAHEDVAAGEAVAALYEATSALVRDVLTAAGYHRSGRGPWRRQRQGEGAMKKASSSSGSTSSSKGSAANEGGDLAAIESIAPIGEAAGSTPTQAHNVDALKRALRGDVDAITDVRAFFDADAAAEGRLRAHTHTGRSARGALLDLACGDNLLARELWQREAKELTASLAGPTSTALESLLIERIVICRMEVNYYLGHYARQVKNKAKDGGSFSDAWDASKQKRMDAANRRFLSAVKTLAQVRRLALPDHIQAIQINLGSTPDQGSPGEAARVVSSGSGGGPLVAAAKG